MTEEVCEVILKAVRKHYQFMSNKESAAKILAAIIFTILLQVPSASAEITLTTLVTFDGTNGYLPQSDLVQGKDGNFYGTLSYGGWHDLGTLFRMSPDGKCVIRRDVQERGGATVRALSTAEMRKWWIFIGFDIQEPTLILETNDKKRQFIFGFVNRQAVVIDELNKLPNFPAAPPP